MGMLNLAKRVYCTFKTTIRIYAFPHVPPIPARLPATVVLVMRRVLSKSAYMPPAKVFAVLPTTREFSTMIPTRINPEIPPVHTKTTTKR
jgi:hypothetical protein